MPLQQHLLAGVIAADVIPTPGRRRVRIDHLDRPLDGRHVPEGGVADRGPRGPRQVFQFLIDHDHTR